MKPYTQGQLDAYCGVYSIINATRYVVGKMTEDEAMKLFGAIMTYLETYKKLSDTATKGHYARDIEKILKHVIMPRYNIQYFRPFSFNSITREGFVNSLTMLLNSYPKSAAIVYLEHDGWDHWSVIPRITTNSLMFLDSDNLTRISINQCVMKKGKSDSQYFFPARKCFFLWRDMNAKKPRI